MSILVHELLLGTGGGRGAGPNLKPSSSSPVPIVSVPVTPTNSSIQVTQLQPNRVVTITSAQSRTVGDKGSRLAEALAGHPSYSYSNSYHIPRGCQLSQRQHISHVISSPSITSSQLTQVQFIKSTSRQSYILPFVLQDHNYGAPPPATPPQSPPPPPLAVSSPIPYGYKIHQIISPSKAGVPNQRNSNLANFSTSPNKTINHSRKVVSEQSILTLNNVGTVQISATSDDSVGSNVNSTVASHILASMPLPRQQFMPHPKTPIFTSPQGSINKTDNLQNHGITSPNAGVDTDEESRLSDQSSSAGPSGEETETAPEGEGEEVQADDSITRCICNFTHDDGYMIQCDRCFVWQHVDCMDIDRDNIPDEYLCEACLPRPADRTKARTLQVKRRQEIKTHLARVSSSDSEDNISSKTKSFLMNSKNLDRKVLKKKKSKPSKENRANRRNSGPQKTPPSLSLNKISPINPSQKGVISNSFISKVAVAEDKDAKAIWRNKRRHSVTNNSTLSGDDSSNSSLNIDQLRSWIEDYEIAVTNHYSQELRARVHSARINGVSQEFRESTQGAMLGHRCRVAPSYDVKAETFEHKVLVATTRLPSGTAIIEYQGKYTLKSQWDSVQIPVGLLYLPFVLQYNMQKEGLFICVDARTYGNDARFARRSNQYNAEIHHVVERGSVHLYIVACKDIEEEEEIILPLETAICSQALTVKPLHIPSQIQQVIELKTEVIEIGKDEIIKPTVLTSPVQKNGTLHSKKSSRKPLLALTLPQPLSRSSRRSISGDTKNEELSNSLSQVVQVEPLPVPVKQRRASGCSAAKSPAKSPMKSPCKSPAKTTVIEEFCGGESPQRDVSTGDKSDCHKMTREERKIAAYMKAFERMEKAAQRRQENQKKRSDGKDRKQSEGLEDDDDYDEGSKSADENLKVDKGRKKGKKSSKSSPHKTNPYYEDLLSDGNCSSSEGERVKSNDLTIMGYCSPSSATSNQCGFRFPKTKKALMNAWLNETVDPVLHSTLGDLSSGVPTCYMRSPSTPSRKSSGVVGACNLGNNSPGVCAVEMAGRSAKKRWLRQAIIDETEPQSTGFSFYSSPNSRPDSPISADYITPLKKRRLARESMSSEQSNTPPSTPAHSSLEEEKFSEEMEIDHVLHESPVENKESTKAAQYVEIKKENDSLLKIAMESDNYFNIKTENCEYDDFENKIKEQKAYRPKMCEDPIHDNNNVYDQLTINISQLGKTVKTEKESETLSEIDISSGKEYSKKQFGKIMESNVETAQKTISRREWSNFKKYREKSIRSVSSKSKRAKTKMLSDFVYSKKIKKLKETSSLTSKTKGKVKKSVGPSKLNANVKSLEKKIFLANYSNEVSNTKSISPVHHDRSLDSLGSLKLEKDFPVVGDSKNNPCDKFVNDAAIDLRESSLQIVNENDVKGMMCMKNRPLLFTNKSDCISSDSLEDHTTKLDLHVTFPDDQYVDSQNITSTDIITTPYDISYNEAGTTSAEIEPGKNGNIQEILRENTIDYHIDSNTKLSSLSIESSIAPIKKKLSILEYRKRKSISCDRDSKEDVCKFEDQPGLRSLSLDSESFMQSPSKNILTSEWECDKELIIPRSDLAGSPIGLNAPPRIPLPLADTSYSPPSPLSPNFLDEVKLLNHSQEPIRSPPKWNAEPTLLEQQRESLTARLRKNFGFCIPEKDKIDHFDMDEKSIEEKLAEIEKRISLSEKLKTKATTLSLSVPPPSFPKVNLSSHLVSPVQSVSPVTDGYEASVDVNNSLKFPASGVLRPLSACADGGRTEVFNKPLMQETVSSGERYKDASLLKAVTAPLPFPNTALLQQSSSESIGDSLISSSKLMHSNFCKTTDL